MQDELSEGLQAVIEYTDLDEDLDEELPPLIPVTAEFAHAVSTYKTAPSVHLSLSSTSSSFLPDMPG